MRTGSMTGGIARDDETDFLHFPWFYNRPVPLRGFPHDDVRGSGRRPGMERTLRVAAGDNKPGAFHRWG